MREEGGGGCVKGGVERGGATAAVKKVAESRAPFTPVPPPVCKVWRGVEPARWLQNDEDGPRNTEQLITGKQAASRACCNSSVKEA